MGLLPLSWSSWSMIYFGCWTTLKSKPSSLISTCSNPSSWRLTSRARWSLLWTGMTNRVSFRFNKPGTAHVGAISKAQKYQKDFKMSLYWWIGTLLWKKNFEKSLTMQKKLKGGPFGIFQHPFCRKISKNWRGAFDEIFFEKNSHRAENTLTEYDLAPLSFLDDVKILLRKLSKSCKKLRNCKIVRIVRKMDHSEWDRQLKKNYHLREKAPTKKQTAFFF